MSKQRKEEETAVYNCVKDTILGSGLTESTLMVLSLSFSDSNNRFMY